MVDSASAHTQGRTIRDRVDITSIAVGALTMAVAAVFWIQRDYTTEHGGTFADPVIIVLGVLGFVLLMIGVFRRPSRNETEEAERLPARRLIIAVSLLAAWVMALPYLGYLVGGIVFFILTSLLMRTRPTVRGVLVDTIVAVITVTFFYFIFTEVMYVRLPQLAF